MEYVITLVPSADWNYDTHLKDSDPDERLGHPRLPDPEMHSVVPHLMVRSRRRLKLPGIDMLCLASCYVGVGDSTDSVE